MEEGKVGLQQQTTVGATYTAISASDKLLTNLSTISAGVIPTSCGALPMQDTDKDFLKRPLY